MNRSTLLAVLTALVTATACFLPWMAIESRNLVITGMNTTGTNFGKPGLLHLILVGLFVVFSLVPKSWGQRANLLVIAINGAWCLRNILLVSACAGGICPTRLYGFYLLLIGSAGMMAATFFTKSRLKMED